MDKLVESIVRVIATRLNPALPREELDESTGLMGRGLGLDSLGVLELVTGLEEELGIFIDESELDPEVFENIGSLAKFLRPCVATEGQGS